MGYDLKPRPRLRIHDVYYDTPRRLLGRNAIGLRIRSVGGQTLLSMKSDPSRIGKIGVRRDEIESPWSRIALANIVKRLRTKGLPIAEVRFSKSQPSAVLTRLGFKIIQERRTTRDVREIFHRAKPRNRPIAEIDVDRVTFLGQPKVRIFEIEIEAKAAGSAMIVQRIGAELESNYSGFLRVWPHGKLVTGLALRKLAKSQGFLKFLEGNEVRPGAFDVIDRTIAAGKLGGPAY